MKARELGRRSVVVGDRVALAGDTSGAEGTLARIVQVRPRTSVLRRSADDTDPVERVIVANAEQLVIVCSLAEPPPRLRFIDRCLVAAYDGGLSPLLCLTKADLAPPDQVLAAYEPLGLPCLVTRQPPPGAPSAFADPDPDGPVPPAELAWGGDPPIPPAEPAWGGDPPIPPAELAGLNAALADRISVLVGQSGVGKSTLVNALIPDAGRAVGVVNPVTGRGRHTSSSAVALRLPADGGPGDIGHGDSGHGVGWLIDTPGLRGFGLGYVSPERVIAAFPDLADGAAACPPGCGHLQPGCALDDWVREHGGTARLDSLRRLLRSRDGTEAS